MAPHRSKEMLCLLVLLAVSHTLRATTGAQELPVSADEGGCAIGPGSRTSAKHELSSDTTVQHRLARKRGEACRRFRPSSPALATAPHASTSDTMTWWDPRRAPQARHCGLRVAAEPPRLHPRQ